MLLPGTDPEVGGWADVSRETFLRIGAGSLAALLETVRATKSGTAAPVVPADDAADVAEGARS